VFALRRWRSGQNRIVTLRRIANLLASRSCTIIPLYLPGRQNDTADELSRMGSAGEYMLTTESWQTVKDMVAPELTLDVFASRATPLLPRYCTLNRGDPEATAVDGLSVTWSNDIVLLHPPPTLILPTIQKALEERPTGVLVLPDWRGQPWFPLLQALSEGETNLGPYQTATTRTAEMTRRGWLLPPGCLHAHILGRRMTTVKRYSTA
jgi:hypothetical protein